MTTRRIRATWKEPAYNADTRSNDTIDHPVVVLDFLLDEDDMVIVIIVTDDGRLTQVDLDQLHDVFVDYV